MTKRYLVKNDMLFKMYKDQWGRHKRYFINFGSLVYYNVKTAKQEQLIVKGQDQLRHENGRILPDHIQKIYKEWIEDEVERMFTGDTND